MGGSPGIWTPALPIRRAARRPFDTRPRGSASGVLLEDPHDLRAPEELRPAQRIAVVLAVVDPPGRRARPEPARAPPAAPAALCRVLMRAPRAPPPPRGGRRPPADQPPACFSRIRTISERRKNSA